MIAPAQHDKPHLDEHFIKTIQGCDFVLYAGLLDLAHQMGLKRLEVDVIQLPGPDNGMEAIAKAVAESEDGHLFIDYGDANPDNVNRMIAQHIIRMASTRAKARVLRDLTNIGMTAKEAVRKIGVTEQTYYRWRKEYGGMQISQAKCLKALEKENIRLKRLVAEKEQDIQILRETIAFESKKLLSPARRRRTVDYICQELSVSERRACTVLEILRSSHRYIPKVAEDEDALVERMYELAMLYGRYGYPPITELLQREGWKVSDSCPAALEKRRIESTAASAETETFVAQ